MSARGLEPEVALAYLRGLSVDLREAVVLDAGGAPLAGAPALVPAARALLESDLASAELEGARPGEVLLAARSRARAVVAAYGPLVVRPLAREDLRRVVARLG